MENYEDKRKNISANNQISLITSGLLIFNGVYSAYVLNYKPKVGAYHIWICSILGILLIIFSMWAFVKGVGLLKREEKKGVTITVLIIITLMFAMWTNQTIPYYKDFVGGSRTITTDSYLVVHDKLYFIDNDGIEMQLIIPKDTAEEFRAKENYEYDYKKNLLKYYDKITLTYYPNSKVIISAIAED